MKSRKTRRLALGGALALLLPAVGPAQETSGQHGIFLDSVDVHLINVEVVVTDKDGQPVTGLTRDDFRILEDGKPVDVANFYAVEGRTRKPEPGAAEGSAEPEPLPPDQRLSLVLFVDNGNLSSIRRKDVFNRLRSRLAQILGPRDRVMLVSQDRTIEIDQPFTAEPALVDAALDRLERTTGGGSFATSQERSILNEIARAPDPGSGPSEPQQQAQLGSDGEDPESAARDTLGSVQSFAHGERERVRTTLRVLSSFISSLGGLPGRKAVLYVSEGLETRPGELLIRTWFDKFGPAFGRTLGMISPEAAVQAYDAEDLVRQLVADANANRVSFYTIDAAGNRDLAGVSADLSGFATAALVRDQNDSQQDSLRFLAHATGGVPLLSSMNVGLLVDRIKKDFDSYYSLGYVPPHRGDGKYHRIEVKVLRDGVRARYLEGYQDKSKGDQMDDRTRAALLLDVADNPLEVRVELGHEDRQKDGSFVVPIQVKIPIAKLTLLPQAKTHVGRIMVIVAVRDEKGRLSQPQRIPVPVSIPNDHMLTAMTQVAGYTLRLAMRPGEQKIAVGVLDEVGAVQSTLNLKVNVGAG